MNDLMISYLLATLLLVSGVSYMFGGKSWATKVVTWPFRWAWKQVELLLDWAFRQIKRAVKSLLRAMWQLGVKAARAAGRWTWRQAKRIVP